MKLKSLRNTPLKSHNKTHEGEWNKTMWIEITNNAVKEGYCRIIHTVAQGLLDRNLFLSLGFIWMEKVQTQPKWNPIPGYNKQFHIDAKQKLKAV